MKKFILPALLAVAVMSSCGSDAVEAGDEQEVVQQESSATYTTIEDATELKWSAWHYGKTGERYGKVKISEAELSTKNGEITNGKFVIDLTSLTVESMEDSAKTANLTAHLKNEDFFLTDSFPTATFEITGIDTSSNTTFNTNITGNLTIKGVAKSISFNANVNISDDAVALESETFEVNRMDWNLNYKAEGLSGVIANESIHNNIGFTIIVDLTK